MPEAFSDAHSATYFPGVVPKWQYLLGSLIGVELGEELENSTDSHVQWLIRAWGAAAAAAEMTGRSKPVENDLDFLPGPECDVQQCQASLLLLAVLVARSLVVLADAMEAAAAAAGITAAQL
jgi:hypothetical protein